MNDGIKWSKIFGPIVCSGKPKPDINFGLIKRVLGYLSLIFSLNIICSQIDLPFICPTYFALLIRFILYIPKPPNADLTSIGSFFLFMCIIFSERDLRIAVLGPNPFARYLSLSIL